MDDPKTALELVKSRAERVVAGNGPGDVQELAGCIIELCKALLNENEVVLPSVLETESQFDQNAAVDRVKKAAADGMQENLKSH